MTCPICHKVLSLGKKHPYAPICSEACRREALRRAGLPAAPGAAQAGVPDPAQEPPAAQGPQHQFEQFNATHLYCPTCRRSMPTRERLLLTLPSGDLYAYRCAQCGAEVGTRTETS